MSDSTEFKNNHVTVSLTEAPGCVVKLDIHASPEATQAAFAKAIKAINKEVSIPGFRKGRAPDHLVLTHYKKHVDDEWKDIALNTAFAEALDLVKKYPFNKNATKQPHLSSLSKEEGTRFSIEFERSPEVPDLAAEDFDLPEVVQKEVTEESIDGFIEEMRLRAAPWDDIADRGVEEGDFVDLDIENLDQSGSMLCENTRFKFVSGQMAAWMYTLLLGIKPGDSVEGISEKDESTEECTACTAEGNEDHHHDHKGAFTPTRCRITLKSIKKPTLPELDEEFAKKVGAETIDNLRENSKKRLEKDAENEKNDQLKESLKKQIEEKYVFDVPKSFVSSNDPEEVTQLRLFFLTSEFAKKNHINVTNNEIYQAAMHEVMTKGELAEDLLNGDERRVDSARTILYTNLLIEKVLNKLLDLKTESISK